MYIYLWNAWQIIHILEDLSYLSQLLRLPFPLQLFFSSMPNFLQRGTFMLAFKRCISEESERKNKKRPHLTTFTFSKNEKLLFPHFCGNNKLLCSVWLMMRQFTWEALWFCQQNKARNFCKYRWSLLPQGKGKGGKKQIRLFPSKGRKENVCKRKNLYVWVY